ncbi:MAG: hypothetical protein AVDCRST_MAG10-3756, partial [uncultured Acidimicrobiales bacterium]
DDRRGHPGAQRGDDGRRRGGGRPRLSLRPRGRRRRRRVHRRDGRAGPRRRRQGRPPGDAHRVQGQCHGAGGGLDRLRRHPVLRRRRRRPDGHPPGRHLPPLRRGAGSHVRRLVRLRHAQPAGPAPAADQWRARGAAMGLGLGPSRQAHRLLDRDHDQRGDRRGPPAHDGAHHAGRHPPHQASQAGRPQGLPRDVADVLAPHRTAGARGGPVADVLVLPARAHRRRV